MVVRRKVVMGVVLLLCVVVTGYAMYTKGDKEKDSKDKTATTDDKPKSESKGVSLGYIGILVGAVVVVLVVAYYLTLPYLKQLKQAKIKIRGITEEIDNLHASQTNYAVKYEHDLNDEELENRNKRYIEATSLTQSAKLSEIV